MFFPDPETKEVGSAPLLFPADEIVRIISSDGMIEYQEGIDFLSKNGRIVRTPDSRIPALDYDSFYLPEPASIPIVSAAVPGRYVRFEPGGFYHKHQVLVTYRHHDEWMALGHPSVVRRLPRSFDRLRRGQELKVVLYGDSLMEGCDASSRCQLPPYLPCFGDLTLEGLSRAYPAARITAVNTAVGGTNSQWGLEEAQTRVADHAPHLVFVNFGMNDSGAPILPEDYRNNMLGIIETVCGKNPEAEFVLLTPGVANPDCLGWTKWQRSYRPMLEELEQTLPGVAVIRLGEGMEAVNTRKRYWDTSGNGVNHPNDFMTRIYAQIILCALSEKE